MQGGLIARSDRDLGEIARIFFKLGLLGFGGPAAHIALMREEVVRRRHWMSDSELLDYVAACNLIPGPTSTELALHLGLRRAGWRGMMLAAFGFIGPAVLMVGTLSWLYARFGTNPGVLDVRYGVLPVVIAIVLHALVALSKSAVRRPSVALLMLSALAGFLLGVHELLLLLAAGLVAAAWENRSRLGRGRGVGLLAIPMLGGFASGQAGPFVAAAEGVSLLRLFLVFVQIGSVLYGSGYVLFAFLQSRLVEGLGWLTGQELLDAIAVGQVTPGPLFSSATFVGWQVAGPAGAAAATAGIFLPSFLLVPLLERIVSWMQRRPTARAFLDGVTGASLGLMAGVLFELGRLALVDLLTVGLAVLSLAFLLATRVNSVWLIGAGLVVGGLRAALI
jgi:chromate transporter